MMKYSFSSLAAVCLLATTVWGASFDSLLEDDVDFVVSFRSIAEAHEAWADHPLAALANDPQLQAFLSPLTDAASQDEDDEESFGDFMQNELEMTWEEFFELFPGQISVAMFNLPELLIEEDDRPGVAFMAEYSGDGDRIHEVMQKLHEQDYESRSEDNPDFENELIEETFIGETLYLDEIFDGEETFIENGYALVDGIFVFADPESRLRSMVEMIKDGPDAPLSDNDAYLRSRERGGRGDFSLYINLEAILPPLNATMLEAAMEGGAAMLGLSAKSLDSALSLESMQAFFLDLDLIDEGLSSHNGIIYREKAGLVSLLTYEDGPLPEARYVPASAFSSSVTTFDFGAMLAQLEVLLGGASPTLPPLIDIQMQNVKTNTGVDLRSSILENFQGGIVSLSSIPEGPSGAEALLQMEQVILVELRDAEALSGAFEALIDLVPGLRDMIEVQEFTGERIHTIPGQPDPMNPEESGDDVSYVITRSHFILNIGNVGLLQNVLTRIESGDDGFWQSDKTEELFERLAERDAVSRSYVDLEPTVMPILQSIVEATQFAGEGNALDAAKIPSGLSVPFHVITEMNEAPDGFFSRSLMIEKEASE